MKIALVILLAAVGTMSLLVYALCIAAGREDRRNELKEWMEDERS